MNIQRKEFEEWAKANGYHVAKNPIGEVYLSLNCNSAWKAWQAAKAQAVPEGYKVAPVNYECIWCGCTELDGWADETMIEAQEQNQ